MVDDLTGPGPRDAQAGGEQAGGIEPPLLITHHRRDLTMRAPLARMTRQLSAPGQAGRRQGLTPGGPGRQAVAGRGQLPQTRSPQSHEPRGADLLHTHRPEPLGGGHQRRVSARLVGEQSWRCIAVSGGALTVSTAAGGVLAVSGRALVVGVLGGHQQTGQQPLHHTGQLAARTQGHQQTGRILHQEPRLRRRLLGRRAHPIGRTTGRVTRKPITFEHMYSIPPSPTNHTTNQPQKTPR